MLPPPAGSSGSGGRSSRESTPTLVSGTRGGAAGAVRPGAVEPQLMARTQTVAQRQVLRIHGRAYARMGGHVSGNQRRESAATPARLAAGRLRRCRTHRAGRPSRGRSRAADRRGGNSRYPPRTAPTTTMGALMTRVAASRAPQRQPVNANAEVKGEATTARTAGVPSGNERTRRLHGADWLAEPSRSNLRHDPDSEAARIVSSG